MLRTMSYTKDGTLRADVPMEEVKGLLEDGQVTIWMDFEETLPEQDEPILRQLFNFHPLAVEDALQQSNVPKLDDWDDYLYIVLHTIVFGQDGAGDIDTPELDIFLGKNYLVTHHDHKVPALDRVWETILRDQRHIKYGADRVLWRLMEEVVSSYMPVIEEMDEAIDKTEDEVFSSPSPRTLERIFTLKRAALHLRRVIGPQREVLNRLARDDFAVIDPRTRVYFRDVYDHLVRMHDITESIRDLVGGALDTYLSVINNRMNDIMKTLTVITTMFMPISFIVGFFGMNFFVAVPPYSKWTEQPVFILMLCLMVGIPFSMLLWIRRKGWL
jgi:magnesium transporter